MAYFKLVGLPTPSELGDLLVIWPSYQSWESPLATNFASFFPMLPSVARALVAFMLYVQPSLWSHGRNDYNQAKDTKTRY